VLQGSAARRGRACSSGSRCRRRSRPRSSRGDAVAAGPAASRATPGRRLMPPPTTITSNSCSDRRRKRLAAPDHRAQVSQSRAAGTEPISGASSRGDLADRGLGVPEEHLGLGVVVELVFRCPRNPGFIERLITITEWLSAHFEDRHAVDRRGRGVFLGGRVRDVVRADHQRDVRSAGNSGVGVIHLPELVVGGRRPRPAARSCARACVRRPGGSR